MHCDQREEIDANGGVECPDSASSENIQTHSLSCQQRYAKIHLEMLGVANREDANHQALLNFLSFLANAELFDGNIEDIPDDTRILITTAISKILFTPGDFREKVKNEWLRQLPEFVQEAPILRRRPRSLSAIPSHDPMSPPRTPRESYQSPRSPDLIEERLLSSSPPKLVKEIKWFWREGAVDEAPVSTQQTLNNK